MRYLVVQEWNNTKGNHAGMRHMCDLLAERYAGQYTVLVKGEHSYARLSSYRVIRRLQTMWRDFRCRYIEPWKYHRLCREMFDRLQAGDEVFLLEYCCPSVSQLELARYIRRHFPRVKIYGLCHLAPTFDFGPGQSYAEILKRWSPWCDKLLTLGSSLSAFMVSAGVSSDKISTGFHYVDKDYYVKASPMEAHSRLRAIAMGAMQRDYRLLADIIRLTPEVDWVVCRGMKNVGETFAGLDNVCLKGYISEDELRYEMDRADISVNIMKDTVGSNVITTSMAMGLAMVVSDVGSIRDYCDESNCVFCENTVDSFVNAIRNIADASPALLSLTRAASQSKAQHLTIDSVHSWFDDLARTC